MHIEKQIQRYPDDDFNEANSPTTSGKIAEKQDKTGCDVSNRGGSWTHLTAAAKARTRVGRPFVHDFNQAVSALRLDDVKDAYATA